MNIGRSAFVPGASSESAPCPSFHQAEVRGLSLEYDCVSGAGVDFDGDRSLCERGQRKSACGRFVLHISQTWMVWLLRFYEKEEISSCSNYIPTYSPSGSISTAHATSLTPHPALHLTCIQGSPFCLPGLLRPVFGSSVASRELNAEARGCISVQLSSLSIATVQCRLFWLVTSTQRGMADSKMGGSEPVG